MRAASPIAGAPRLWRIVCAILFLIPAAAAAQTADGVFPAAPYVGKTIVDVRLTIENRLADDAALAALVETRPGEPFSMLAARESMGHLFNLGRFEDVQIDAAEAPGGVRLTYKLVPIHAVSRVDFSGTLGVSEGVLRKAVTDRFGLLPTVGRAAEAARTLEQLFFPDHGYLNAKVAWKPIVLHDPDRTILEFDVDAGARAKIGAVEVHGDLLEPLPAFKQRVGLAEGAAYEPSAIRAGLEAYVHRMRGLRRYQAVARYVGDPARDGSVVNLSVTVDPGPVVSIAVEGDPLPASKLSSLVPLEKEGSASQDLIEDSARRIRDYLYDQGYWKAEVTPERRPADGTLVIVFNVHKGPVYHVAEGGLSISGNTSVAVANLPAPPDKLQAGRPFVQSTLDSAAGATKARYLELGYASVKVVPDPEDVSTPAAGGLVKPALVITEGPKVLVGDVGFENNTAFSAEALRGAATLTAGDPYFAPRITDARDRIVLEYLNTGYASVQVTVKPNRSSDGTRIGLTFMIDEGPQTIVDHIMIVGNVRTRQRIIERELKVQPGQPLGLQDLLTSRAQLTSLGLFRRVQVTPVPHENATGGDVLVTVEEAAATTLSYGGGAEASRLLRATGPNGVAEERLDIAPRGFFNIGRRNIGGKNRSLNLFTRLSLRPSVVSPDSTDTSTQFGFSEYRVVASYREPKALGPKVDFTLTGGVEQGVRSTFNFARQGIGAELVDHVSSSLRFSGRYSFGKTRTFDESLSEADQVRIDRFLPGVRLSTFSGAVTRDSRDDGLDPSRGALLTGDAAVAAVAIGSQVGFVKTYVQGSWFHRLPAKRRVIFASRLALGLANGFPRLIDAVDENGNPTQEINEDLPASERFFAGGDTTIRGFDLDTVGAPETISSTGFPKGGNAVLIVNTELRVAVRGNFGAAVFVDGGNVFNRVSDFDFGELRGAYGFGIRYFSPIGPIRLDLGFKMDRRVIGGSLEPRRAFHFSIGQAF